MRLPRRHPGPAVKRDRELNGVIFAGKPYIFAPAGAVGAARGGANVARKRHEQWRGGAGRDMGRIIKALAFLAIIGFAALVAYAYLGDLAPEQQEIRQPVTLDAQ